MCKKVFLLMWFALVTVVCCVAQNNPYREVSIASPTVASLGKYADIPVGYHTGLPQISIPIYTIKEGPLSLPINLSYHAGGVKVMEPAGWVGTGFTLNAGGVITRTVRGAPDEATNTGIGVYGHFKDYGFSNYLTHSGGYWDKSIYGTAPGDAHFASGVLDGEPDLFFFNFAGYSGKFYFNDDRTPVLVNGEDLKIEYYFPRDNGGSYTAISSNIQGFRITVPDGTKYYFGMMPGGGTDGANPVEMSFPFSPSQSGTTDRTYSSWYLRKIESADGVFTINFTYQSEAYSYYTISMFPIDGTWMPQFNNFSNSEYKLVRNYIDGVRLSQISFSNGTVSFIPAGTPRTDLAGNYSSSGFTDVESANTDAKALAAISINNNNGFCKQFNFLYSYFTDDANPTSLQGYLANYSIQTDKTRLKLESVTEQSCDGSAAVTPYRFEYYSNFLPRRLSFAQDHWGYYNGATTNNTLIPTYTTNKYDEVAGANRDAKWPEMQHGALTKIIYPTGGSSAFEFESHTTWINTKRYASSYFNTYSIGYSGGNSTEASWSNVYLGGEAYHITFSNSTCPQGQPNCTAGLYLIDANNNSTRIMGVDPGTTVTKVITVPVGTYTIKLVRPVTNVTGNGASATFREYAPVYIQKNETVGGLRIKTITRNDGGNSAPNVVTSYDYNQSSGQSSGMLYSRPAYVQLLRNDIVAKFGYGAQSGNHTDNQTPNGCMGPEWAGNNQKYFKSPCPIFPMSTTQGNHIGYNEVKVTQAGNGSSVYRYYGSNIWDFRTDDVCTRNVNPQECLSSIPSSPAAPPSFEYKRGLLKYEGHFNEAGKILKDVTYYYDFDSTSFSTPCYLVKNLIGYVLGNQYVLRGYWKSKEETVTTEYIPNTAGSITATNSTYFESPWHHMPTRKESVNSKGHTIGQKIAYAQDFRIAGCDAISTGLADYNSACSACDAAAIARTNNCADYTCQYWAWSDNKICWANARKNYITTRRNNYTNSSNAFATCMANAKNSADASLKPILELRDVFDNAPVEVTSWNNNKLATASFTHFDYASNPSNKVYPAKVFTMPVKAAVINFSQAAVSNSSVTKDNRYTQESSAGFNVGNLADLTAKNGINNAWLWDYKNTVPVAKIAGAASNAVAFTSFEADGTGNWSVNNTIRNAGGVTGNNCYQLTNGPVEKLNLNSSIEYAVSYWASGGSCLVSGTVGSPVQGKTLTINGVNWTYYQHRVTGVSGISVSGNGLIDELRLYPKGAQMTTYTYQPLVGISSQTDATNRITYYEYDGLGRVVIIRDEDRNILKKFCYSYAGQQSGCDIVGNEYKSQTFTKQGCNTAAAEYGSSVPYTVDADTYFAPTREEANAKAQAEIDAKGQNNANAIGQCLQGAFNDERSGMFTRQTCNANETPGSVPYTVPAGRYTAPTKTEANQLADADFYTNGQRIANETGSCTPIQNVTINIKSVFSYIPGPNKVEFLQNGTVVQTVNFPAVKSGSTSITLPAGSYTMRFTVSTTTMRNNTVNYILDTPTSWITEWVKASGVSVVNTETVTFSYGTTYNVTATNML
jgi:YD repeat-containing protein